VVNVEAFRLTGDIPIHEQNSDASPTPAVDGGYVYLHFGSHGTACIRFLGEIVGARACLTTIATALEARPSSTQDLLIISCDGYDTQW
jgi:outer membrane protein assembly factor BamB